MSSHTDHNNANLCYALFDYVKPNLAFKKISLHTGHLNTIQSMFTLYMYNKLLAPPKKIKLGNNWSLNNHRMNGFKTAFTQTTIASYKNDPQA